MGEILWNKSSKKFEMEVEKEFEPIVHCASGMQIILLSKKVHKQISYCNFL